ncbi:McrB family protein [Aliarcobacter butzleri]|uniref:McrB family protein n=1 Tax=Aliarcobacter butzleri TaxID=28197 RepID=UPI0021B41DE8|nr:AAA family ATPase [Aliarcobacter butzleri]MCT7608748.1 AAA family ATPase [Aliarcobacter butzleri]
MSEKKYEINDYKSAFAFFKQRFLVEKKSIFRLNSKDEIDCNDEKNKNDECCILTKESVQYLIDNFVNNGYTGDVSFEEKVKHQLLDNSKRKNIDENIVIKAIEILATVTWLWRIPPSNAKNRKESIVTLLMKLGYENKIILDENNHIFNDFTGFASTGTYYNTNKPTELAYIIQFLEEYLKNENLNPIDILKSEKFNGKMEIKTTKDYSYDDKENKKNPKISDTSNTSHDKPRTVSIHNALLHLFDCENYEPILSNDHKEKISKAFKKIFNISEDDIDKSILKIKEKLKGLNVDTSKPHFFYENSLKNIWQGGLDFESKNMILHGAPGTGKTYMTEETVKSRKLIEQNSEYELVQFHPSYVYEDFIEGIKPIGLEQGQMRFELKNGIFKQMCIDAFKNLIETDLDNYKIEQENKSKSKEEKLSYKEPKRYYFIADEINRAELSRVFGELLLCLEDDKRLRIVDGKVEGTKIKTQNSNLWKNEHIVVKVNEDNKLDENGKGYFGVPENIYFIGTMNDIDRSVDSFDMALRRRFVWKHYKCDYEAIENKYKEENDIENYIKSCIRLNNYIVDEKGFNLSDSYELGQAYFMKPKNLTKKELDRVWLEHISPILKEYLRAEYSEKDIIGKLEEAQNIFKLK